MGTLPAWVKEDLKTLGIFPLGQGPIDQRLPAIEPRRERLIQELVQLSNAQVVVEVGSWEGGSAVAWARALLNQSSDAILICIDTWLGSLEMILDGNDHEWSRTRLFRIEGYPTVYRTFLATTRRFGVGEVVIPIALDSSQGLELLRRRQIVADVVYVDARHSFGNAYRDLVDAIELLDPQNPNAIVCGDAYHPTWLEVQAAVHALAIARGLSVITRDEVFMILNANQQELRNVLLEHGWHSVIESEQD